jgi:integrase
MNVDVRLSGMDKLTLALSPKTNKKVINRTLNNLMTRGSNVAKKKVRERYNIKAKQLNRYIKAHRSNVSNLEASINIRSRSVSLFNFVNRGSISSSINAKRRSKRRPVKVKILKGGGAHKLRHAFLMMGKNNNVGIFERVPGVKSSTGKDKIKRLNTIGPSKMFEKEGVPAMQEYVDKNTARIFKSNFDYYIGKVK